MLGDKFYALSFKVCNGGRSLEQTALTTSQRARSETCKNTVFQFNGESDKKLEKCFIGNFTFTDKSSPCPKMH